MRRLLRTLGLAATTLCVASCQTVVAPTWAIPDDAKTQVVNGYPLTYSVRGSGPVVVIVAGVLTDYRVWQRPLGALESHYRIIAVSPRHFFPEKWDGKGNDFVALQHGKDLDALIESLGGPVYLVGWSYGGRIAYEAAHRRPDLIRRLVLVEAPLDALIAPQDSGALRPLADGTARFLDAGDVDGGLKFAVDLINGPGAWAATPEAFRPMLRDNAWTVVGAGRDRSERVTCVEFGSLTMPVLLVKGETTTPFFKQALADQSKCLPQATLATIPKAGHSSPLVNPQAFRETLEAFLPQ